MDWPSLAKDNASAHGPGPGIELRIAPVSAFSSNSSDLDPSKESETHKTERRRSSVLRGAGHSGLQVVRAGETVAGDVALVGFDGGTLYWAGRATGFGLPRNPADHTAQVYGLHDASYLYFLARLDDDQIQTRHGTDTNWANDCVEIYIDPSHDGGSFPMDHSASDIQLVIDVANRKNVYMTGAEYKTQVLDGVISAVTTDSTGWWLEVQILKSALAPAVTAVGTYGLDFNFRDNDGNNNPTMTTVCTWSDTERSGRFPSKIPNRWGQDRWLRYHEKSFGSYLVENSGLS
jgi:hypothetical protein